MRDFVDALDHFLAIALRTGSAETILSVLVSVGLAVAALSFCEATGSSEIEGLVPGLTVFSGVLACVGVKFVTSFLVIRPSRPVPVTCVKSIFFSWAILRTAGE